MFLKKSENEVERMKMKKIEKRIRSIETELTKRHALEDLVNGIKKNVLYNYKEASIDMPLKTQTASKRWLSPHFANSKSLLTSLNKKSHFYYKPCKNSTPGVNASLIRL